MQSQNLLSKKITLLKSDQKRVRVIAAKTKMSEQAVLEKALRTAQPLLKLITQAARARK
jgi:hypothetical protein